MQQTYPAATLTAGLFLICTFIGCDAVPQKVTDGRSQQEMSPAKDPSRKKQSKPADETQDGTTSQQSAKEAEIENGNPPKVSKRTSLFNGKDLEGWEVSDFAGHGEVDIREGQIIINNGVDVSGITWQKEFPKEDYEVHLDAMRVDGIDFFCGMTFRVGDEPCSLIVGGWGGALTGLSNLDNFDASENETTLQRSFKDKTWYHIRLKVTDEKIMAWIDDEQIIDVLRADHQFSIRPEVDLSQPFGIATYQTTAALKNIELVEFLPESDVSK